MEFTRVLKKAPDRIELSHKGFADLSLTAWVRRRDEGKYIKITKLCPVIY